MFHKLTDKMRVSSISSIKRDVIGKYIYIEYSNQRDEIDINHEKHGLGPEVWVKNKDYPQLINLSSEAIHPLISSATVGNPHESTGK